jgi:predicted enzyme related to lactoylglutathione lyase
MTNSSTHFEIYGEQPTSLAEFYRCVFGWQIEQMSRVEVKNTTGELDLVVAKVAN